jgi:hypothetical protein
VLGLILLVSIALRFTGLDWGIRSLEGFTHEGKAVSGNNAGFNADALHHAAASLDDSYAPRIDYGAAHLLFNSYGTVFLYLSRVSAFVGGIAGDFEPFGESARDSNLTRVSGRWVSAVAGVALVWVSWVIGNALFSTRGAIVVSLAVALFPMSAQAAHLATVDGLLGLWFGAALWSSLRVLSEGRRSDYVLSGVFVGLATATKINGLFLFLPLGLSHLLRQPSRQPLGIIFSAIKSREIYVSVSVALVTWVILTPAAVFEYAEYFSPEFATSYHIAFSLRKASEGASATGVGCTLRGRRPISTIFLRVPPWFGVGD